MPYPPLKSENYTNFGGINVKVSQYITNPTEFLNLQNVDFKVVGALGSFAGSTVYTTQSATSPITGLAWLSSVGSTIFFGSYSLFSTDYYHGSIVAGTTFYSVYDYLYSNQSNPFEFTIAGSLFATNQYDFFVSSGNSRALQYSLPKPYLATNTSSLGVTGGLSGILDFRFAFIRNDGFIGPATSGRTLSVAGVTTAAVTVPILTTQLGVSAGSFGISGLRAWVSYNDSEYYGISSIIPFPGSVTFPASLSGWAQNLYPDPEEYFGTFLYGFGSDNGATTAPLPTSPLNPGWTEIYANQLFAGGFRTGTSDVSTSSVWYSQVGDYEKHELEGFFEVRPDDGDFVYCGIAYFTQLVLFKGRSVHVLTGADPDSFQLSESTNQYGCYSRFGACVWEQKLWFVDSKGIAEFNGSNTKIVSNKVEPYFKRMTNPAAAFMVHVKERNEVWTAIAIDGSAYANLLIVYDYAADAWTTRTVPTTLTYLSTILENSNAAKERAFIGSSNGSIWQFGSSLLTDNGTAFTNIIKARFNSDMGHSVEKMFRRLYLDCLIPAGTTQVVSVNLYADQGVSPYLSTTMILTQFQKRLDFGVPAKDLSVELIYGGGQFLQLNGYTLEYRFQRAT